MRKILLTSSGFETNRILEIFLRLFEKDPVDIKALFVPTAATFPAAISKLPKSINDLLKAGILSKNIKVFDLHRNMNLDEIHKYDVIYFSGGNAKYLLNRINTTKFNKTLMEYIDNGGVYVGVSAGSVIATNNLPESLNLINCTLSVHMQTGTKSGAINTDENPHIELTRDNVILILGDKYEVLE